MPSLFRTLFGAAYLTVSALMPLAAHANPQSVNALYVFGDSLSDGGNYIGPGGPGAFPPPPYASARYSNGLTAVEALWQTIHPGDTSFKPSNFGGTNYALGGATTGTFNYNAINSGVPGVGAPGDPKFWFAGQGGVANQVQQFAGSCNACFDPSTSLFTLWAFPNDVFANAAFGYPPSQLIGMGVSNIIASIQALAGEGALHFLVPNMPDLGATPEFRNTADAPGLTQLTLGFNAALAAALDVLDAALLADITQFDTFASFDKLIHNPGQYGFANVTDACVANLQNGQCNPATWLFWDGVHPTAAAHAILGAQFAATVPEPSSWGLVLIALLVLVRVVRPTRRPCAY